VLTRGLYVDPPARCNEPAPSAWEAEASRKLIGRFQKKTHAVIAHVWGEEEQALVEA